MLGTVKWTRGDVVIRKFAHEAGLEYPDQISSNKLRKQIATVMQILNLNQEETEQFAQFMGHTEKTHNDYYRLPQDIYQTAKISKLLLLMERGVDIIKVNHYMKLISTHKKSWLKKNRKMMMILKTYIQLQYLIH
ncbi:uncharacterized protein isoform X2 [Leptinotarsa decemlineata]|uniref:uncharacterized protein isoform X2 n=1 Tax=Leptinotarsa decemlineata TaxID=7539 RepID=UPI003D308064